MNAQLNAVEIAWLAGLLEGEGCFGNYRNNNGNLQIRIQLRMVDEDTVTKVQRLYLKATGKYCNINIQHKIDRLNEQPVYTLIINGDHAKTIMRLIVHLMGSRRRRKIWQILNGYEQPKLSLTIFQEAAE